MKKCLIFILIYLGYSVFLSCNNPSKTNSETNIEKEENINQRNLSLFDELLLSSDFPFPDDISKNDIYTSFDNEENNVYTYRIYFEADGTGTIGWVKYDINCNVLYDISGDIGILPRILTLNDNKGKLFRNSLNLENQNCPEEKITSLPFNYISWVDWQTDKDMSMPIEDENRYFYYPIENNFRLNYYYNFQNDNAGISAYKYFYLETNKDFNCYIVEFGYYGIAT